MTRRYPIQDLEYHQNQLREIGEFNLGDRATFVSVVYHTTAIAYLEYGSVKGFDGPAAEIDGKPVEIYPEFQLGIDSNGQPFMRHFRPDDWKTAEPMGGEDCT